MDVSLRNFTRLVKEALLTFQASKSQSRGPSPNRGVSLPDFQAIGPEKEPKTAWRELRGIDQSKQVRITKLSHMRYQHPNLAEFTVFLRGEVFL